MIIGTGTKKQQSKLPIRFDTIVAPLRVVPQIFVGICLFFPPKSSLHLQLTRSSAYPLTDKHIFAGGEDAKEVWQRREVRNDELILNISRHEGAPVQNAP
jgi:hypothetical protein